MRDEYGEIGIEETHDPEAWMEFHHQPINFPGDPIVLEEQAEQPDEQMGEGEEEVRSPFGSSLWLKNRIGSKLLGSSV